MKGHFILFLSRITQFKQESSEGGPPDHPPSPTHLQYQNYQITCVFTCMSRGACNYTKDHVLPKNKLECRMQKGKNHHNLPFSLLLLFHFYSREVGSPLTKIPGSAPAFFVGQTHGFYFDTTLYSLSDTVTPQSV